MCRDPKVAVFGVFEQGGAWGAREGTWRGGPRHTVGLLGQLKLSGLDPTCEDVLRTHSPVIHPLSKPHSPTEAKWKEPFLFVPRWDSRCPVNIPFLSQARYPVLSAVRTCQFSFTQ